MICRVSGSMILCVVVVHNFSGAGVFAYVRKNKFLEVGNFSYAKLVKRQ